MLDLGAEEEDGRRALMERQLVLSMEQVRRRCEVDFAFFAQTFWHTIEPGTQYVHGYHIEAIVDHLVACLPRISFEHIVDPLTGRVIGEKKVFHPGHIRKLLITMPPRHMKSTLLVLFCAWVWTTRPEFRWLMASYSLALSIRDTMRMRVVVMSPLYQRLWAFRFRLLPSQNEKDNFANTSMGYRLASSPDAGATGEGGDCVAVDDAMNVAQAESEAKRSHTSKWWFESMGSRQNNPDYAFFLVMMQRVHEKDLPSECIERGYVHLNLPARYERSRHCTTVIGWDDWRKEDGELLWPRRFSEAAMQELWENLGEYGAACQLQQDPKPRGGAFIKREWFKDLKFEALKFLGPITWVRSWDLALTKTGDRVASVELGQTASGDILLRRGLSWREDWTVSLARIKEVGRHERNRIVVESIGTTKSAGEDAAKAVSGFCVSKLITDKTNKVSMAMPWIAMAQAGRIYLVDEEGDDWPFYAYNPTPWRAQFLDRFCAWIPDPTLDQTDDEVDAVSLGYDEVRGDVPLGEALAAEAMPKSAYEDQSLVGDGNYGEDDFGDDDDDEGGF